MYTKLVLSMVVVMMAGAAFAAELDRDGADARRTEEQANAAGADGAARQAGTIDLQHADAVIASQQGQGPSGVGAAKIAEALKAQDGGRAFLTSADGTPPSAEVLAKAARFTQIISDSIASGMDAKAARLKALSEVAPGQSDEDLARKCGG